MKKILFSLVALVASMSMNAQIVKLYKNGELQYKYKASEIDEVLFIEEPTYPFAQGQTTANGNGVVKWIQLWENGPKFADRNVGASSVTEYGGYYTWGGTYNNKQGATWKDDHNEGAANLTGADDTATALWGSNWRMPTSAELQSLLDNCRVEWTDNYNGSGIKGRIFTGRGAYEDNSIFFPAAGHNYGGDIYDQNNSAGYWSSTLKESDLAQFMSFGSTYQYVDFNGIYYAYPVRAVLAESTPLGQGEAIATGIGLVKWIQLWENGPKFAEYNVGATPEKKYGGYYTWYGIYENGKGIEWKDDHGTANTATTLWGNNWRTPSLGELEALSENCSAKWINNYNGSGINGMLFTGKGDYAGNSVFFPAAGEMHDGKLKYEGGVGCYWTSNNKSQSDNKLMMQIEDWGANFDYLRECWNGFSVRAVLAH